MIAVRLSVVLAACVVIPAVLSDNSNSDLGEPFVGTTVDEDIGYMNNVMDEYRRHVNPRPSDVTAPPAGELAPRQRYQLWKRNANIINTLLGFPRRMLMAGR